MVRKLFGVAILLALLGAVFLPAALYAQADFYKGKNLTIIQGREPGGSGDLRTKALVPFLQKYLPGNPTIMMEYMPAPGAQGGQLSFPNRKPDGLTIGNPSIGMISSAVLGESGVQYDIDKFSYLGSPYSTYHAVFVSQKTGGL